MTTPEDNARKWHRMEELAATIHDPETRAQYRADWRKQFEEMTGVSPQDYELPYRPADPDWWEDAPPPSDPADYGYASDNVVSITGEPHTPSAFVATPFQWRDERDIPPRKWLYGRHLLRKFISVDVAAGGIGKSSVKIGQALAMASNRAIYREDIGEGPLRVWLYNLEDPDEETERRLHATAKRFEIDPEQLGDRLFVNSGRTQPCVIADETPSGARIVRPIVDLLEAEIKSNAIDVLIIDPFVSSHSVDENNNRSMDLVVKEWAGIADRCNCSINLVHHVRKGNGTETTAESARGAKSITDAARSVIVYNRMTKDEAERAGISAADSGFFFRTSNDKANLAPPEVASWYRMNNEDLLNGDKVGVACPWDWPDPFRDITATRTAEVQRAVHDGQWRHDPRAENWVGVAVAQVLDMDTQKDRKRLSSIIHTWVENGVLKVVEQRDEERKLRKFVVVGQWMGSTPQTGAPVSKNTTGADWRTGAGEGRAPVGPPLKGGNPRVAQPSVPQPEWRNDEEDEGGADWDDVPL